jgi:hypothetical protein
VWRALWQQRRQLLRAEYLLLCYVGGCLGFTMQVLLLTGQRTAADGALVWQQRHQLVRVNNQQAAMLCGGAF